ncbi:hypothetical protein [Actinomyces sp. MRS3W]|uniref:hypothetical protein n=1 Tax=Actinomyces sp. MRS3W TaxID=2800796 RepID=UPI0028FD6DB3|nr:hypothetical protein [Actinomyces sp. MRS3W]MDU0349723.1 hypothetical protein [Actinomyces sp. MRS3W]
MDSTNTTGEHDSARNSDAAAPEPCTSQPKRRRSLILLTLTLAVALAIGVVGVWWRPWETEEPPAPPPETVCNGLYETAELNRILGSQIGSDDTLIYGARNRCAVSSGKPPATSAKGYQLYSTIMFIDYWRDDEYDAGNGYKWTDETMAADTENDVQKLDIPELEGNTYLWIRQFNSEDDVYGIWFGDGFIISVNLPHPENGLDGPRNTQEAVDVMPELLTYIGTNAQKHPALPAPKPTDTPSTLN